MKKWCVCFNEAVSYYDFNSVGNFTDETWAQSNGGI